MFLKQIWVKIGVLIAALAMLYGCSRERNPMMNARNTPIVVSGGSITGHTHHKKDWSLPNGAAGSCPKDGLTGPQTCLALTNAIPEAVVTSANFTDTHGKYLYQQLSDPNWKVVVTGSNDGDQTDNPSLTIAPAQDCGQKPGEACVSFTIGNSSSANFGPRHQKIGNIFDPHQGRSVCRNGKCDHYHIKTVTVQLAGKDVATATCAPQQDSCLVCFADSTTDTSACELK